MGARVFVTYAREDGPDDARRLIGVLERILGPGSAAIAAPAEAGALDAIGAGEIVVALIGPGWRGADDELAAELSHAFAHRIPVIPMLMRKARMPARDVLPPALGPLLDNHPRLTVEMPSDFYWDVTTSHLGRWLARILDEVRNRDRDAARAAETAQKARRELERTRARLAESQAQAAVAAARSETARRALADAATALEASRGEVGEARGAPGLRVFICHRPETGGDVRTLERDLRERLDGGRLSSSEPSSDTADPIAVAEQRIARADVVLAVIGPHWTGPAEGAAGPRLDAGEDPVRLELEAALRRRLPVIPVLTQHAPMPAAAQLPESLRALATERAYELIVAFWSDGIADLVERLEGIEDGLRRRERALEDALARHRELEHEVAEAGADEARASAAIRSAQERETQLDDELRRVGEEEERLRHEPRDANGAYQDGPGEITLDGRGEESQPRRREPDHPRSGADEWRRRVDEGLGGLAGRGRLLAGAVVLVIVVVIIIVASH